MDWLKRAEDLFEVVDRRAKVVASELTEEQSSASSAASNGKVPQGKRSKTKAKAKKKASAEEHMKKGDRTQEDSNLQPTESDSRPDDPLASSAVDNNGPSQGCSTAHTNIEVQDQTDNDSNVQATDFDTSSTDVSKHDDRQQVEAGTSDTVVTLSSNGEPSSDTVSSSVSSAVGTDVSLNNYPINDGQSIRLKDSDDSMRRGPEEDKFQPIVDDTPSLVITDEQKLNIVDATTEPISNPMKQEDGKAKTSLNKVQEQLEEAQGLLKSTNPTGQSKEARLARVRLSSSVNFVLLSF